MSTVQFGMFENFKGADTLLIWGDGAGLAQLAATLQELATGRLPPISIHELPWAKSLRGTRLFLSIEADGPGVAQVTSSSQESTLAWRCSIGQLTKFADQIASLSSPSCKSGHQYLDAPGQTLQVMISKGEYPIDFE